jgi:D-alanyl-D-alanine carboxypeptidase (penicillin-binding protein 5/6)
VPLSRRQIYRRRRTVVFGGLALVLATAFYLPATLLAPLSVATASVVSYTVPTTAAADIDWPDYGASAITAVGFDGVLGSAGSTKALPMASISKLITTLVVLEKKPLAKGEDGPTITMDESDIAWYNHYLALNGSIEPVRSGQQLTQLQLLEVTLIPSANNYASSMVDWAYGSESAFLHAAHAWLKDNGLDHTTFVEPTGIDAKNASTATDLVHLGELALANPVVASVVKMKSASIPDVGIVENTNKLLGIDGVTGLKTGTLGKGRANLLFSSTHKVGSTSVTIVGVVLGGVDHDSLDVDIRRMLKGVYSGFHTVALTDKGVDFGSYTTAWKQKATMVSAESASVVVWGDTVVHAAITADDLRTGSAGQKVGTVVFTVGDPDAKSTTVSVDLTLESAITDPGPGWRLTHPFG